MARTSSRPSGPPVFGHSDATLDFWRRAVREARGAGVVTPFYLFDPEPVAEVLGHLAAAPPARMVAPTKPAGRSGQ